MRLHVAERLPCARPGIQPQHYHQTETAPGRQTFFLPHVLSQWDTLRMPQKKIPPGHLTAAAAAVTDATNATKNMLAHTP